MQRILPALTSFPRPQLPNSIPEPVSGLRSPPVFYRSARDFLRDLSSADRRFWVLVVATGAAAGIGAALLVDLLRAVEYLAWRPGATFLAQVRATPPVERIALLIIAGLLVTVVSLLMRQPLGGHGTAGVIEAIWTRAGKLSLLRALVRGIVSIIAVGMGASLGREGALIQTGAATGSWLGARLRIPEDRLRVLVVCGAAAGIAAAYNVPIGGALFGLEVLLGSFALELLGPIVVSCVVATLISRALVIGHPTYLIPHYELMRPSELLLAVAVAPLLGLASALYTKIIDGFPLLVDRLPRRLAPFLPIVGLALLGAAATAVPELLGNGYDSVNAALLGGLPLAILIGLPLAKLAATTLCAGAGVPGGLFTPSLFYGALLGGALGRLGGLLFPGAAPPGAYALIGMGAVLAGTTHATFSAVLIIFELTGDYGVILPLMLACALSAEVSQRVEPDSLYTAVLRRRDIVLPEKPRPEWLRSASVRHHMRKDPESIVPTAPFEEVVLRLLALPPGHDLYVVAIDGTFRGIIVLDALKGHIPDRSVLGMIVAADVMDETVPPLPPDLPLYRAMERFAETALDKLPVVDSTGRLHGMISKTDLLKRGR